jgi:hypothetical protein
LPQRRYQPRTGRQPAYLQRNGIDGGPSRAGLPRAGTIRDSQQDRQGTSNLDFTAGRTSHRFYGKPDIASFNVDRSCREPCWLNLSHAAALWSPPARSVAEATHAMPVRYRFIDFQHAERAESTVLTETAFCFVRNR